MHRWLARRHLSTSSPQPEAQQATSPLHLPEIRAPETNDAPSLKKYPLSPSPEFDQNYPGSPTALTATRSVSFPSSNMNPEPATPMTATPNKGTNIISPSPKSASTRFGLKIRLSSWKTLKRLQSKSRLRPNNQPQKVNSAALSVKALLSGLPPTQSPSVKHTRNLPDSRSRPETSHTKKTLGVLQNGLLDEITASTIITDLKALAPPIHPLNILMPPHSVDVNAASPISTSPVNIPTDASSSRNTGHYPKGIVPTAIRAVCLECNEEEADKKIFSSRRNNDNEEVVSAPSQSASTDNPHSTISKLGSIRVVNLLPESTSPASIPSPSRAAVPGPHTTGPDDSDPQGHLVVPSQLPLGMDVTLLGAVPSPKTIADGMNDLSDLLLALGLSGEEIIRGEPLDSLSESQEGQLEVLLPNHKGIYPPTDRMSIISYWWGYEIVLPQTTIQYFSRGKSIASTVIRFLSFFALVNGGVREILPFIKYIAQFMDLEWDFITSKDEGKGVVCAATWVIPVALVPRPWDFSDKPATSKTIATSAGSLVHDDRPLPPIPSEAQDVSVTGATSSTSQPKGLGTPFPKAPPQLILTHPTPPRSSSTAT